MLELKSPSSKHACPRDAHDRRQDDCGPPCGWNERRRMVERRLPVVKEDEISECEWFRAMAAFLSKRRAEGKAIHDALTALDQSLH